MIEYRTDTFVRYARPALSERCMVFDMDDTLCHYDKSLRLPRCHEFKPRREQLEMALDAQASGVDIIIATARPCWTVPKTISWLSEHLIDARRLYVKNRKNWTVAAHNLKRDMLQDILTEYRVESFHDDSPWTVAAARALGVNAVFVPGNEDYWVDKGIEMGWVQEFQLAN